MNIAILGLVFLVFLLWYRANALEKRNKTLELAIETLDNDLTALGDKHNQMCQTFIEYVGAQKHSFEQVQIALFASSELMQMIAIDQDNTNDRTSAIEEVLGIKGK